MVFSYCMHVHNVQWMFFGASFCTRKLTSPNIKMKIPYIPGATGTHVIAEKAAYDALYIHWNYTVACPYKEP